MVNVSVGQDKGAERRISNVEKGPAKSINNGQLAINNFECNVEFPRSIEMQEYLESSKNLDIRHSALYIVIRWLRPV
jgi:hypothetical protein